MLSEEQLQEIEERYAALEDLPWTMISGSITQRDGWWMINTNRPGRTVASNLWLTNADFILHAPDDVRELLTTLSALRTERDKLAGIVRELAEGVPYWGESQGWPFCLFCKVDEGGKAYEDIDHKPTCLWRRAKEMNDAE